MADLKDVICLDLEPWQAYSYANGFLPGEEDPGGEQPLYRNPCLQYLGTELNKFVMSLPKNEQATPGKYFVKSTRQVQSVNLFVGKCPDGTIQNTRLSICEPRPGKDLSKLCLSKYPLTGKSEVEMLQIHVQNLQKEQQENNVPEDLTP